MRPLWVYMPPGYDEDSERRYPVIYVIQGLTGQIDMWRNRTAVPANFRSWWTSCSRAGVAASVLVFVDAWTSIGGSQFVDSPGTGRYHTYIARSSCRSSTRTTGRSPEAEHRGIAGNSSGGYGAMVNPMLRPDVFGGLATHAGDALFEMCYLPEFRDFGARAARPLRRVVRALLGGLPRAGRRSRRTATTCS